MNAFISGPKLVEIDIRLFVLFARNMEAVSLIMCKFMESLNLFRSNFVPFKLHQLFSERTSNVKSTVKVITVTSCAKEVVITALVSLSVSSISVDEF